MSKSEQLTPIQELYKGKTIFITGGSGFMGKVILRSYSILVKRFFRRKPLFLHEKLKKRNAQAVFMVFVNSLGYI